MTLNRDWHLAHKMPQNPTLDQRVAWHLDHAKNCSCRKLEGKILDEIKKRGLDKGLDL
jgi:hypothetical protein